MAALSALGVVACLVATYVALPRFIFPPPRFARNAFDRLLIDLLRMTALVIVVAYVLVPLRLFQVVGVLIVFVGLGVWTRVKSGRVWSFRRGPGRPPHPERLARSVLIVTEAVSTRGNPQLKREVRGRIRALVRRAYLGVPRSLLAVQLTMLLPLLAVLAGSLIIRLWYPMTHEATAPADNYVHLAWLKHIQHGRLFVDGVYPRGLHTFLALTTKIAPVSAESLIRYAGPFLNTFFVFVIYVMGLRATASPGAALVTAAVVGLLGPLPMVGQPPNRQIGTLPQEFAVLMGTIGVLMAIEYAAQPHRARLYLVGMAAFVVAMSHPLGAAVVGVGAAAVAPVVALRARTLRPGLKLLGSAIVGGLLGNMYLPIGVAVIGGLQRDPVALNPLAKTSDAIGSYWTPFAANPLAMLGAAGLVIGLVAGLSQLRRSPAHGAAAAATAAFGLGVLAVALVGSELLHPWYVKRWAQMTSALIPLGLALGLGPVLSRLWGNRPLMRAAAGIVVSTALVVGMLGILPPQVAQSSTSTEYESEARTLDRIIASHRRLEFTVVGTPEWYVRVLNHGYHVQLIDFADSLTMRQAVDPAFDIPVPSRWVYILTEKRPFPYPLAGKAPGVVGQRYQDLQARADLMRRVTEWVETYRRYHDDLSVWYEDDVIRIYLLEREPNAVHTDRDEVL